MPSPSYMRKVFCDSFETNLNQSFPLVVWRLICYSVHEAVSWKPARFQEILWFSLSSSCIVHEEIVHVIRAATKLHVFSRVTQRLKGPGKRGHIVADTNVSPFACARNICCGHKFCVRAAKNVSDFVQKHFASATNVPQFVQPKEHHGQQCVRNNVSSFTRALRN